MNAVVDTSVVVRYLVQDDLRMGAAAAQLLDGQMIVDIGLVTLAETAYVLTHHYAVPRAEVVDILVAFVRKRNIRIVGADETIVADSLTMCRSSGRVSFADALILAEARSAGIGTVWSFDGRFPNVGVDRHTPGEGADVP